MVSTSFRERGKKEVRIEDEELDIGQVVSAGGWGIFFMK